VLALAVCYIARLEENTREQYIEHIAPKIKELIGRDDIEAQDFIRAEIEKLDVTKEFLYFNLYICSVLFYNFFLIIKHHFYGKRL